MAKILDSQSITSSIQKVAETPAGYIINGHYYDKKTMSPKPLKLYETYGSTEDLAMDQRFVNRHNYSSHWSKTEGSTIIRDDYDPEVFYVFSSGMRSNNMYFHSFRENDLGIKTIKSSPVTTTHSYPLVQEYCGQNEDYIYIIYSTTTGNGYLARINKLTFAINNINTFGTYSAGTLLKETSDYIYYAYQRDKGDTYMHRYSKSTHKSETMGVEIRTGKRLYHTRVCNTTKLSDVSDYTYALHIEEGSFEIDKYLLDYSYDDPTKVVTESKASIDWGQQDDVLQVPLTASNADIRYELFITKGADGERYLNISISNNSNSSVTSSINDYGIYTFKIDKVTRDLTFTGKTNVSSTIYRGFLGVRDNTFLVCMTDANIIFCEFDEMSKTFNPLETLTVQPYHVGIDQAENIWFVNGNKEVEMISPFVPTVVEVEWAQNDYKYTGTPIDTYITIEARNYSNTNIEASLGLTIKGDAVFMPGGKKTVEESTSASGPTQVLLQITGSGSITIYPKLILQ